MTLSQRTRKSSPEDKQVLQLLGEKLESGQVQFSQEIIKKYARLPFYCGKNKPIGYCCLTHLVGLPKHPASMQKMRFMLHQDNFCMAMDRKGQRKIHVNKSRQIGYTEIVLRKIQHFCLTKYAGGHVRFITGVRIETAKLLMNRFRLLFDNIREVVLEENDLEMTLANGTHILALPSTSGAIRGDTKINCIFIDEAAHFGRIDDSIVMDAFNPHPHGHRQSDNIPPSFISSSNYNLLILQPKIHHTNMDLEFYAVLVPCYIHYILASFSFSTHSTSIHSFPTNPLQSLDQIHNTDKQEMNRIHALQFLI